MLKTIALISLPMFVNWQKTPKIVPDDLFHEFAISIVSELGGIGNRWLEELWGIIRPNEQVLAIPGGAYIRLRDTSGGRVTVGGRVSFGLVVTNQRIIWLHSEGLHLFWSLKNISELSLIRRGDLRFIMSDGSRVQVALDLWMLRKARIARVNMTLEALMRERLQHQP